jgi:hypothetical protein
LYRLQIFFLVPVSNGLPVLVLNLLNIELRNQGQVKVKVANLEFVVLCVV